MKTHMNPALHRNRPSWCRRLAYAIALVAVVLPISAGATSIAETDFATLCDEASLIFEGTVISVETHQDSGGRRLWTRVEFRVLDGIKGARGRSRITLEFLGGTHDGLTMSVAGMSYPTVGEHGIYFVEREDAGLANPLLGWHQGEFLVEPDATGTERVTTRAGRGVAQAGGPAIAADARRAINPPAARGLELTERMQDAMQVADFKARIRARLDAVSR